MRAQTIMVKRLQNSQYSSKNKGFVVSLDTFFAIIILLGVISYLGLGMMPTEQSSIEITTQTSAKQILDDAITAMDNNGFIGEVLVDDSGELTAQQAQKIYDRLKQLLPSNMDANIKITRFEQKDDLSTCRSETTKKFEDCFKTEPENTPTKQAGTTIPIDKEIFYGNQLFMKRQPYKKGIAPNTCIIEAELAAGQETKETKALFDETPTITTKVSVTDNAGNPFNATNKMQCFDSEDSIGNNEAAIVTLEEKSGIRPPVSVMTVMDRSGSMGTYDMTVKEAATGTFNNGTCLSYPVWTQGKVGNALNFNGIYSYVTIDGNTPSLQLTGDLTIEFWAKPTNVSTPNRQNPICKSYGAEFCLTMEPDGILSYYHGSGGMDTNPYMSARTNNAIFTNNNWVHVAIVRNNSARTITFYKNAALVSTGSWSSGYDPITSIYPLKIGWAYVNDFNGIIDEVRIYNRQLSADEINQGYQLGLSGLPSNITSGLAGYWAFNEGTGSIATDSSGTGNNGTLRGFYPAGSACQYNNGASSYWATSTNCPSSKTQVAAHTNQQTALTYDISPIKPYIGSSDKLDFLASPSCSSSLCTSMRLWIKRPDSVIESDWSDYYEDVYNPAQYAGNNYDINVWAAGNCNYYIYLRQYLNTNNSASGSLSGIGTHDGIYNPPEQSCSNFGNWQKATEYNFNTAYDKLYYIYWNINYNTYSVPPGQCYAPKFQIRHVNGSGVNDYNWPATTDATGYCGSGGNGSCTIWVANNNPILGPFVPSGKYELWGWSDAQLSATAYPYAFQSWGIVFGNLSRTDSISGGTCSGTTCYDTSKYFPGIPIVTNCPSTNESLSRQPNLPLENWKVVDKLSIPPNLKKAKAVMDYWDYQGACPGGALGFQNPISGPNVFNWWYVWPKKNQYYTGCFSVNDSSTGCSYWSSGTTMPAGDYNVLGWADETTSYRVSWYVNRMDAAVNAAKSFLNNANWKAGDKMGIVSYASTATTDAQLTDFIGASGKAVLEAVLDALNPGGETNIGDAIAASITALVSSMNTKFIVLMSDGQANKPEPAATAVAYAIQKADEARAAGITVYTIGFGANAAATDLKDIAKEPCNEYEPNGKCKAGKVRISGSIEENLVGYWKFDEGSGTTASDSSGNGNNGTLLPTGSEPIWQTTGCKNGNCLSFDGVNDYVNLGNLLSSGTSQITVSSWVYKRDGGDDRVVCKSTGTSVASHIFCLGVAGTTIRVRLYTTNNNGCCNYDAGTIPLNEWVHLAFSYNGSTLNIYKNSQQVASYPVGGSIVPSNQTTTIANVNQSDDRYWYGSIDEVKIYNSALTADEILQEYNGSVPAGSPKFPDCFINNDANTLTIDPAKHCGRYYYAGDPQTLQQVYDLIAKEIGIALSNVKIVVNPASSELVCKCNNVGCATECDLLTGNWTTLPITFNTNLGGSYAAQSFKARIDCNGSYCEKSTVDFPPIGAYPKGTFVQYGETAYEWGNETNCDTSCDCNLSKCVRTVDFLFRDLGIKFTGGTINDSKVNLDFNIKNNGLAAITPSNLQIGFYKDQTNHLHADGVAGSQCQGIFPPNDCIIDGAQDYNLLWHGSTIGAESAVSFRNIPVNGTGYIKAVISGAKECPLHNESKIYCLADSKVYYFRVEYSAWVK